MIPDRKKQVRVRANIAGEVDILVHVGERLDPGQCVAEIEGAGELERLASRKPSTVLSVHAATDDCVEAGALLLILQEHPSAQLDTDQ